MLRNRYVLCYGKSLGEIQTVINEVASTGYRLHSFENQGDVTTGDYYDYVAVMELEISE